MTDQEKSALDKTVELWNDLNALEVFHIDDMHEVKFHIHAIQNIIMARGYMKKYPCKPGLRDLRKEGEAAIPMKTK